MTDLSFGVRAIGIDAIVTTSESAKISAMRSQTTRDRHIADGTWLEPMPLGFRMRNGKRVATKGGYFASELAALNAAYAAQLSKEEKQQLVAALRRARAEAAKNVRRLIEKHAA